MKTHTKTLLTALATCTAVAAGSANALIIQWDFDATTTAWDKVDKTSSVSTNTFTDGVTGSDYLFQQDPYIFARETAIIDGQTKAKAGNRDQTHTFSIIIPDLAGTATVDLTNLQFIFDSANHDSAAGNASWTLSLNQGSAGVTSFVNTVENGGKAQQPNDIALSGLTGLNDTTVTFTIMDTSGGNNSGTNFWTGFDDVTVVGTVNVVPEPGSLALLGLGGLLIARRRRD